MTDPIADHLADLRLARDAPARPPGPGGHMSEEMSPYSDAALAKQRLIDEKIARGEQVTWSDLCGYLQPNPNLPDCQAWEDDYKCQRPNHHDGPHRVVIEWGGKTSQEDT